MPHSADHLATAHSGPVALVTGAGSGIGRAFCLRLADRGYGVVAIDRDPVTADETAALVRQAGAVAHSYGMDVSDASAWDALPAWLAETTGGRLDLLVCNAGVLLGGELDRCEAADALRVVATNLGGALLGCRTLIPLLKQPVGSPPTARGVINIASIFAAISPPGFAAYNASKAGVVALSETLRGELAPHGLRVTVAAPGVTPTGLFAHAAFATPRLAELADRYLASAQLTADDVAEGALRAFDRNRLYAPLGAKATRLWRLKRWLPQRTIDLIARRSRRELDP
ncbi:putative oxidoreductase SadH [Pseudobythopirellula maris]|uniref:Putative oxidoreductase SadH n=1 Tax=Pseudobythopirellula maris TaxID=2527991 RepID=A0A5C5ZIS5_9BACT|nr:SDR family NAD(P)-dependent oxidoreductase [Pseudobythopirellula maris]TWT87088.1 putative oxidoreductase SadH [Pseudobythopirellula maris]